MAQKEADFRQVMNAARECMDRYEVALSVLAKEENSPHMTEELRLQLAEADRQMDRYKLRPTA